MSHSRQRKDKICLNCGTNLHGLYCHHCGQENIEPKVTAFGLVTHFFYDITHFDGKFFSTVKYLMVKPGFLSAEYVKGRRASYLEPIKMYVFTSAIFFLVFFSIIHVEDKNHSSKKPLDKLDHAVSHVGDSIQTALKNARTRHDSVLLEEALVVFHKSSPERLTDSTDTPPKVYFNGADYPSKEAYDSIQQRLPAAKRDGWYKRQKTYKMIALKSKLQDDPEAFLKTTFNILLHKFPQLLFISLPIIALLFKLLYIRRKQFYYGDHAIFTIHLYIFTFISIFLMVMFNKVQHALNWQWMTFIQIALVVYLFIYEYKAMRNFYGQGRFKTFIKFAAINMLSFLVICFLFALFFVLSIFEI